MAAEYFPVNYELKQKIEQSGRSFIHSSKNDGQWNSEENCLLVISS